MESEAGVAGVQECSDGTARKEGDVKLRIGAILLCSFSI
jgi:hypothetical protein